MKHFSLDPDPWNEWIYDPNHPDYNTERAEFLRIARARALCNAPKWMLADALSYDTEKDSWTYRYWIAHLNRDRDRG